MDVRLCRVDSAQAQSQAFCHLSNPNIRKAFQQNREIATKPDNNKTLIGYLENG